MINNARQSKALKCDALSWDNAMPIKMVYGVIVSLVTSLSDCDLSPCIHGQ